MDLDSKVQATAIVGTAVLTDRLGSIKDELKFAVDVLKVAYFITRHPVASWVAYKEFKLESAQNLYDSREAFAPIRK